LAPGLLTGYCRSSFQRPGTPTPSSFFSLAALVLTSIGLCVAIGISSRHEALMRSSLAAADTGGQRMSPWLVLDVRLSSASLASSVMDPWTQLYPLGPSKSNASDQQAQSAQRTAYIVGKCTSFRSQSRLGRLPGSSITHTSRTLPVPPQSTYCTLLFASTDDERSPIRPVASMQHICSCDLSRRCLLSLGILPCT
jgi:hypothetical protein